MFLYTNGLVPQIFGPGLTINVSSGVVFFIPLNQNINIASTAVPLAPSSTNFVYLDCNTQLIASNSSSFPTNSYPIAIVVTSNSGVLSLVDSRSQGIAPTASGGGGGGLIVPGSNITTTPAGNNTIISAPGTKISQLTDGGAIQTTDLIPIVRGGKNYKAQAGAVSVPQFGNYTFTVASGVVSARNNLTGAVDFFGTDAAIVINNVLNTLATSGGRLYFKSGTYNLNSCTQENTGGYTLFYCIGIPGGTTATLPMYNFICEAGYQSSTNNVTGVNFNVTAAAVTAAGAGNTLAAFWQRPNIAAAWNTFVMFDQATVQFPTNSRGKQVAFHMRETVWAQFANCFTDFATAVSAASAAGNIAYDLPATPCDGCYILNSYAHGYDIGFSVNGEHSVMDNPVAYRCTTGFYYGKDGRLGGSGIFHEGHWNRVEVFQCINALHIGTNINPGAVLDIDGFDLEYTTSGPWAKSTFAIEDNAGKTGGVIRLSVVISGVGTTNPTQFFEPTHGGQNYIVIKPGYKPPGTIITSSASAATTGTIKQSLKTFTIPAKTYLYNSAGSFGTAALDGGDYIRIKAWGTTAVNGNNKTFEIDWGGTTIASMTSAASGGVMELDVTILTNGSTNNSQECIGRATDGTASTITRTLATIDTSSNAAIVAAATTPTSSGDFTMTGWTIEYVSGSH